MGLKQSQVKSAAKITGTGLIGALAVVGAALGAVAESDRRERLTGPERLIEDLTGMKVTESSPVEKIAKVFEARKCGWNTVLIDCEDRDCSEHRYEKRRLGIGTPVRDFWDAETKTWKGIK